MAFTVTPWEVSGEIDYEKLITEFGTERLDDKTLKRIEKHAGTLHHFLRRKIFFSHRGFNWLLDEFEKGNKFFLYTGRGPSGNTHMGHIIPWLLTKWLQEKFDTQLWFQLTDDEKFLFKGDMSLEETNRLAYENALDFVALGFDPKKTFVFVNTDYAKTLYREALKVAKKLTFSTTKAVFGFKNETNVGQIFFTSMQTVPAFLPSLKAGKNLPCLIPCAIDQDPHFRISRDILPKLGYYKPASIYCKFLPGLTAGSKMSASIETATIYTTDSPEVVRKKIMKYAFSGGRDSIEEHRKKGGNPDVDVAYQWLTFFEEDDRKLKQIHDDYRSGKLLSGEMKQLAIEKINGFLAEHQKKREKARDVLDQFILRD